MELTDFDTDVNRVLDEVLAGRVDLPWLRGEIERLAAARHRLSPTDREWADLALDQLRDYLAADEMDAAWSLSGAGEHPVVRAVRIRATAGYGVGEDAARMAQFKQGVAEIHALANAIGDPHVADAVRHEAWLLEQQITAVRLGPPRRPSHRSGGTELAAADVTHTSGRLSAPLRRN